MKIVFFHISDLHIMNKKDIKVINVNKIADVLSGIGRFDAVFLIVSGDIAYSGKSEQYSAAYNMFGTLITEIKSKHKISWVEMLVVPGNHDVDLDKDEGSKVIQEKIRRGVMLEDIEIELKKQRNYLNFAKGIHCLNLKDRLCLIKSYKYNDKIIKIALINTAIFSTLDEDKGLHYLPSGVIEKLEKHMNGHINIMVFHHAHHWMNDIVKSKLEDVLFKKIDIVLCGHEHDIESKVIERNNCSLLYLTGGELCDKGNWEKSEFYLDVIDTDEMSIESHQFLWNKKRKIYQKRREESYMLATTCSKAYFSIDEEFQQWVYNDQVNTLSKSVFDYYVFPDLELIDEYSNKERTIIGEKEELIKYISENKRISIVGGENSGKTLLLKKLFVELNSQDFTCLLCDVSVLHAVSIKKSLQNMFRYNYKDIDGSFDEFLQIPKEKRVVLLDNVSDIKKEQVLPLLKFLEENFGVVIYTTKENIEIDLTERIRQNAELVEYSRFKLLSMYAKKRKQLISNVLNITVESGENEELSEKIANAIKMQRKMYAMNPSFVIQFTQFYLKNFKDAFATDGNIFSKVYESNIINKIRPVAKKLTVDKILVLLDKMAYLCYQEQRSEIDQQQICNIITSYNEEHGDEVEFVSLINACIDSKIIKQKGNGGKYRFTDKNSLSYFIAREIIRKWNDELDDTDLKNLTKYVRYGINANIILFITYLTDNLYLIRHIVDSTVRYTEGWIAFDPVNVNVPYLSSIQGQISLEAPSNKDKEKNEKEEHEIDRKEIMEYENSQIEVKDYFELDTQDSEEVLNQILRSMTLLDITSKCLPGFEHRMMKADKDKVVDIIFQLPGKIFYLWANQIEEEKEDILKYLLQEYRTVYLKPRDWDSVKEEDMMYYLQTESISLLLDLLNLPINNATRDYTIKYLLNYTNKEDLLCEVQLLMAYKKLDRVSEFERLLLSGDSKFKKSIPNYMRRRVLKHFLIASKRISNDKVQSLISKYFPANRPNQIYRNMLISREKNSKKQ